MSLSTRKRRKSKAGKPRKPSKDFPLFPHDNGQWAKKVRGKLHYFGLWNDPEAALNKWLAEKDDLLAGRTPRVSGDTFTVKELVNRFLTTKKLQLDSGEITPRTWADYHATCERLTDAFGLNRPVDDLASDDFERLRAGLAKTWGLVAVGNEIQRVRVVFKYADDAGLIDRQPRYGPAFRRPSKKALRKLRQSRGPRMFEADELRRMVAAAGVQLKAMILLGINAGFGNTDVARLPLSALDLDGGWVRYPRPKTGVDRRCPLWPETVEALRAALAKRPAAKDPANAGLVFLTRCGAPWARTTLKEGADGKVDVKSDDSVSKETTKLLKALGIARPGLPARELVVRLPGGRGRQPAVAIVVGGEALTGLDPVLEVDQRHPQVRGEPLVAQRRTPARAVSHKQALWESVRRTAPPISFLAKNEDTGL